MASHAVQTTRDTSLVVADVQKTGKSDIEAAAGMVSVRINGLYFKWPQWGYTLMSVADCMSGTKSFYTKAGVRRGAKKCVEDSMTVPPPPFFLNPEGVPYLTL
jgi:hypothetical protein